MKKELTLDASWNPVRYSKIYDKCPREIVMLRGRGCRWRKCRFCDYHLDCSPNEIENFNINQMALGQVTGQFGALEVINSGSFSELDSKTVELIKKTCRDNNISVIYIESHFHYRDKIAEIKAELAPLRVRVKLGVETFDINYREQVMNKGIGPLSAVEIAAHFEDCCLLVGLKGQTKEMISNDIALAEKHFDRICINVFIANGTGFPIDEELIAWFKDYWYPRLKDNPRFDVLLNNNAFGVGGVCSQS